MLKGEGDAAGVLGALGGVAAGRLCPSLSEREVRGLQYFREGHAGARGLWGGGLVAEAPLIGCVI